MKNKILTCAAVLLLLAAGLQPLQAQAPRRPSAGRSAELIQILGSERKGSGDIAGNIKSYITSGAKLTPQFQLAEHQETASKQENQTAVPWIEVTIPFTTNLAAKDVPWLENVVATVELMLPVVNDRMQQEWGVLRGTFNLAPVANRAAGRHGHRLGGILKEEKGQAYHILRAYVSPYVVSRYLIAPGDDSKKLRNLLKGCPIRVTLNYNSRDYMDGRPVTEDFLKAAQGVPFLGSSESLAAVAKKMGPLQMTGTMFQSYDRNRRAFFELNDVVIPGSKTPWAWIDYDRQEHTIDESPRR